MKVLQVNSVYGTGSTGKIVEQLHVGLKNNNVHSVVCYGRGMRYELPGEIYKTCGELYSNANHFIAQARGQLYGGCYFSTRKLISIIKKEKPDIVHLQCINGFFVNIPRLLNWLKKNHVKTVLTLHAEFIYTANCGHARDCERWKTGCGHCPQLKTDLHSYGIDGTHSSWIKMQKAFAGFDQDLIIVSVSPWLRERALQSPFLKKIRHEVVLNGVDVEIFRYRENLKLREGIGEDRKIVFFATTYFSDAPYDLKGGRYVLELSKRLKNDKIIFWIAGEYDSNIDYPANMIMLGRIQNQTRLAEYYSMADVTILTSLRETFSMVTAESLCCGTPVVGFLAGGPESIAIPEYSRFVVQGDVDGLEKALLDCLKQQLDSTELEKIAQKKYSRETMTQSYIKVYSSALSD